VEIAFVAPAQSLPEHVRRSTEVKVGHLVRHAPFLERAEVRFSEESARSAADRCVCEVVLSGHGHTLRAKATGRDQPSSLDVVVEKLEHQVERLKGKLVGRSQPRKARSAGA
jgi:ribosomal subunit interface protein